MAITSKSWQRMGMAIGVLLYPLCLLCVLSPTPARSQSIEFTRTHLVIGHPLDVTLRIRFDQVPPHPSPDLHLDCIDVQIHQGEAPSAEVLRAHREPIRSARTHADTGLGRVMHVRLRGHAPLQEPWIQGRVSLHCGTAFTRAFTLLVEPTTETTAPKPIAQAPRKTLRRVHAPQVHNTPPAAAPRVNPPTEMDERAEMAELHRNQQHLVRRVADLEDRLQAQERAREEAAADLLAPAAAAATVAAVPSSASTPLPAQAFPWGWLSWAAWAGTVVTLWVMHRHRLPQSASAQAIPSATPSTAPAATPEALAPAALMPTSAAPPPSEEPSSPTAAFPWPTASGGTPSLDAPELEVPLSTLDQAAAEGYLGATLAVIETALQSRQDQSADLLLRLLDGYEKLQQPMNRARVASQLEALYNLRITETGTTPDDEMPAAIAAHVVRAWQQPDRPSALARLLLKNDARVYVNDVKANISTKISADVDTETDPIPCLDLATFRDVLWLHHLCSDSNSDSGAAQSAATPRSESMSIPC